jgi:hypothetical protein
VKTCLQIFLTKLATFYTLQIIPTINYFHSLNKQKIDCDLYRIYIYIYYIGLYLDAQAVLTTKNDISVHFNVDDIINEFLTQRARARVSEYLNQICFENIYIYINGAKNV